MAYKKKKVFNFWRVVFGEMIGLVAVFGVLIFCDFERESFSLKPKNSNYFKIKPTKIEDDNIYTTNKKVFNIESSVDYKKDINGVVDSKSINFQDDSKLKTEEEPKTPQAPIEKDENKLNDINYIKSFYTVDPRTVLTKKDFVESDLIGQDMKIKGSGVKVLIFHTHAYEGYEDSDPQNINEGVVGVGAKLKEALEAKGIETMHVKERFDMVEGTVSIMGAYERMEPVISQILEENKSIEIVIDIHRDAMKEGVKLLANVEGRQSAKIMFVNGLSKMNENGEAKDIEYLGNKYLSQNLAFSFQMQQEANLRYEGFMRKIYLNAFRYSLHMAPKSLLIEVGAQTNTKEEAFNTVAPIANILEAVVAPK